MASFSYQQHHPFLLDQSFFFPTTTSAATATTATTTTTTCLPQFLHQPHDHPYSFQGHHIMSVGSKLLQSPDSSISVVLDDHKVESGSMQLAKKRKDRIVSSLNSAQSKDTRKEMNNRLKKQKKSNDDQEEKKKKYVKKCSEEEEGQIGYIHVRARRGQATDSHSLAERVRREKISERMKLLQSIVPGCDKVTGKALMLDEIINYVQSLQNQVEFLSMKLASVNPMFYDFGVDLETFVLKPDQSMSSMELPIMQSVQEQSRSPIEGRNTFTTGNDNYSQLIDNSSPASLLFHQDDMPNILSQGSTGQLLWDMDGQRQKLDNAFALSNMTFFH